MLAIVPIFLLISSLSIEQLAKYSARSPNRGTWRSGKNGLIVGLVAGLVTGVINGLFSDPYGGFGVGLYFLVLFGLDAGLDAFARHFLLRFLLWRSGALPWKLIPFLDEATERLLLYQAGGGYFFVHRSLLEYLASLRTASPR